LCPALARLWLHDNRKASSAAKAVLGMPGASMRLFLSVFVVVSCTQRTSYFKFIFVIYTVMSLILIHYNIRATRLRLKLKRCTI
jgi:hypothetical protein